MDRFDAMKAFVAVAELGSFTKAAERLEVSNQLASKYVSQLENHLGVRLLNRTTRRVHLTEAGERCLQQSQDILESLNAMEGQLGYMQSEVQGVLQISAPLSFATLHLGPLIREFQQAFPLVNVDLQLSDRKIDVVEEGFDLALRIGHLSDSSLIAKHIAPVRLMLCASPRYLKKNGSVQGPDDLNPQHYLRYSYLELNDESTPLLDRLKQISKQRKATFMCNNGEMLAKAAIAGEGYVLQPTFIVGEAIKQKQLTILLPEHEPKSMALYAVYPHRKLLTQKLGAFIQFMENYFGSPPYWDEGIKPRGN